MKRGFTLIELLVVIAIIALLASIVISSLRIARTRAVDTAVMQEMSQMRAAAELYLSTNGDYGPPRSDDDIAACSQSAAGTVFDANDPNSIGPLIISVYSKTNGVNVRVLCGTGTDRSSWAFAAPLNNVSGSQTGWCVDGTGAAKAFTAPIAQFGHAALIQSGTARCP